MCLEQRKAFCSQKKFKARPRVCLDFSTGTNRVLKAAFLNRTPKEKLANEAAAAGEGPPHTPALGATPQPRTRSGEARRGHLKFRGFFLPSPAFLVTTNKEREKWEPQGERGEGERAAGGGGEEHHLPRDGGALPGRIQPHKMGAVCKQPPAWVPRAGGGGRGRAAAAAAPARAAALLPPGARSRPDFPGGGARRRGRGRRRRRGAAAFSSLSGPFSGLPRLRRGPATAGDRSPAGRTGGRGQRVKPPPRPAQTSAAVCSPSPHPDRHPRTPLPGRGARSGRPPRRRGESTRLR